MRLKLSKIPVVGKGGGLGEAEELGESEADGETDLLAEELGLSEALGERLRLALLEGEMEAEGPFSVSSIHPRITSDETPRVGSNVCVAVAVTIFL